MKNIEVGIIGSRGYVGAELNKRLSAHPSLTAVNLEPRGDTFAGGVPEVVIFSLPDGLSDPLIAQIRLSKATPLMVDISSDHRFDPAWTYGLPEHFREQIRGAERISNPGCYATAMQLGIRPILDLVDSSSIVASGTSGYSGAGKKPTRTNDPDLLAVNHVIPYKTVGHQHEREVATHLGIAETDLRFMPRSADFPRGIILEMRMRTKYPGITTDKLVDHYRDFYQDDALVSVTDEMPDLSDVVETDKCVIGGFQVKGQDIGLIVVIDNLGKGAAGQAVQNINIATGSDEFSGLIFEKSKDKIANTFSGKDVLRLSGERLVDFAGQVSAVLSSKTRTMLQWNPSQILESMAKGRAALVTGEREELFGFAQVWEYEHDLFEHVEGESGRKVLEVGSWLSFKPGIGIGQTVLREGVKAGRDYDPEALIIAIVEQGNDKAQKVIEKIGGKKIGQKFSPDLRDESNTPALMYLYDLSEV